MTPQTYPYHRPHQGPGQNRHPQPRPAGALQSRPQVPVAHRALKPVLKDKRQVVAGFVVFRRTEEGTKYLLLYRRGSYWNFPKGHFEAGEDSLATAFREAEEETGLKKADLRIISGFKALERFSFEAGEERIHDTVILYLAETKQPNIRISPREHSGFAWFLYDDAIRVLGKKYAGTKRVLKQANDFLHPSTGRRPERRPGGQSGRPGRRPWRARHHPPAAPRP